MVMNLWLILLIGIHTFSVTLKKFVFEDFAMGVIFRITLYTETREKAENVARKAFERVKYLDSCFSDYQEESEINRLSKSPSGDNIPISQDLFDILKESQNLFSQSEGVFDVSLGRLTKIWREAVKTGIIPEEDALKKASSFTGFKNILLDNLNPQVTLIRDGIHLDLGGIAKGYAAEEAGKIIEENGVPYFLIDASGDLYAGDYPENKPGWQIMTEENDILFLKNQAIATSGDTYRGSHIIDPRTGYPTSIRKKVTVWGKNGSTADALATILSIIEEEEVPKFMNIYYPEYHYKIYHLPLKEN